MSDKLQSRKFAVWLVWLIIAILVLIIVGISFFVTKAANDKLIDLFADTLQNFFYVSAIYLGVNVLQKGAFAIADVLSAKKEEENDKTDSNS